MPKNLDAEKAKLETRLKQIQSRLHGLNAQEQKQKRMEDYPAQNPLRR